jgi:hypothetical protein
MWQRQPPAASAASIESESAIINGNKRQHQRKRYRSAATASYLRGEARKRHRIENNGGNNGASENEGSSWRNGESRNRKLSGNGISGSAGAALAQRHGMAANNTGGISNVWQLA